MRLLYWRAFAMPSDSGPRVVIGLVLIATVVMVITLDQWRTLRFIGDGLSPTADPWTESDTVRAGEGYADRGFAANWGLPDLCYGERFSNAGTKNELRRQSIETIQWVAANASDRPTADRLIYTHYPPGPHLILGLATMFIGRGHLAVFRVIPITAGLAAIVYLFFELVLSLGPLRAGIAALIFAAVPMFTDMMHGLSYQGYSLAALLVEIGLSIRISRNRLITGVDAMLMAALGFLQGYLGFDYLFLVALVPMVIGLTEGWVPLKFDQPLLRGSFLAVMGFALAHTLHFVQVALYFGSFREAMHDFIAIGTFRSMGTTYDNGVALPSRFRVLWDYLTVHTALPMHFYVGIVWITLLGLLVLAGLRLVQPSRVTAPTFFAVAAALAICSMWVVLMPQYSAQHWHFIPRHYFVALFVPTMAILKVTIR
jgi:hypothetical protein